MEFKFKALKHKTIKDTWGQEENPLWIEKTSIPYLYSLDTQINYFYDFVWEDYDLIEITVNY